MDTLKVCTTFVVFELGQLQLNQSISKVESKRKPNQTTSVVQKIKNIEYFIIYLILLQNIVFKL